MVPQPVVSTTFKRLKREWNEEKAKKELRELIAETGGRNVSRVSKFGYKDVWVGSQSYRYNPEKPLSKPLIKAMFNQTYVSYNVEMTKGERKRHRDRGLRTSGGGSTCRTWGSITTSTCSPTWCS